MTTLHNILEALDVLRFNLHAGQLTTAQAVPAVAGIASDLAQIIGQSDYDLDAHMQHLANQANRGVTK